MNKLKDIQCFCLDLDGTIYLSSVPFDGAINAVHQMQKQARVLFLTNNSSLTRQQYYQKLLNIGFNLKKEDIYGSATATIDYLKQYAMDKSVYLLGNDDLNSEFLNEGLNILDPHSFKPADIAVIAFDKTLTYKKLQIFCRHLLNGAFFVATHTDKTCPTVDGDIPDVGSFLSLVKTATGLSPNVVCGKPSKQYGQRIMAATGFKPNQIAMVGDRLSTDIKLAQNCGFKSVLVLSGETKMSHIEQIKRQGKKMPDVILNSISDWDKA